MTQFYKPEGVVYHNDGREQALLRFIRSHPQYPSMKGCPERILQAIDEYGHEKAFMMNVGSEKGEHVTKVIQDIKPRVIVEVGGYIGYSAVLLASTMKLAGGEKFISLERSPVFAKVSSELIKLAGLDDIVEIRVGACRDSLRALAKTYANGGLDMIFLDHAKHEYVNDLKLCEELRLVVKGTTVVADNVSRIPQYLEYVRASTMAKEEAADEQRLLSSNEKDWSAGRPGIEYETMTIHSIEPTGEPDAVEVSRCLEAR